MIYNDLVAFDTRASWGRASATEVVVSLNGVSYVLQCPRPCYFLQRKERTKKERFLFFSFSMMLMMILSVFSSIPRGLGCRAKKTRQNVLTTVEMSFSHLYFPIRLSDQVFCFASFLSIFFFLYSAENENRARGKSHQVGLCKMLRKFLHISAVEIAFQVHLASGLSQ